MILYTARVWNSGMVPGRRLQLRVRKNSLALMWVSGWYNGKTDDMWLPTLSYKELKCSLALLPGSLILQVASCHIMQNMSSPLERCMWWRTRGLPPKAIEELRPSANNHVSCKHILQTQLKLQMTVALEESFMAPSRESPSQNHPVKMLLYFWPAETEIMLIDASSW